MADTMEIIISAVDSASEVFQSIIGSATSMGEEISDAIGEAGSTFDEISSNVEGFGDAVANVDSSTLEELGEELGMSADEVQRLIESGADMGNLSAGFNEAAVAADDLKTEIQEDVNAMNELGSAGDVMAANTFMDVANGMKDSMLGMAESAGTFNDSMMRASLEAQGAGISVSEMKDMVSELSETTGRAGGQIRESFIKATARGVTDMNSFKTMMEGAGAQATLLGTDIQTMGDKFSSMAQKDTLMARSLAETGITMNELGDAMGMTGATADEVRAKWKELDTNQRAAILGMAASMNEGQGANDAYKNSWAGLQEQLNIAKGRFERIVGSVILPVLIPAMKLAGDILNGVGDAISAIMAGPLGGLVSVIGTLGGTFLIAVTGAAALRNFLAFLKIETLLETAATWLNTAAKIANAEGSTAAGLANAVLSGGFMTSAAAAWSAAVAFLAATWPLWVIIGVAALVVAAVYEIGKAFGWWDNVREMIDAVRAGLMKMWDAFINHPDVQAAIQLLGQAWEWLVETITSVGQAVLDFFGINESGNFDVVQALIDGIGFAWQAITLPIRTVISLIQMLMEAFGGLNEGALMPLGSFLWDILSPAFEWLTDLWNQIVEAVQPAIQVFQQFMAGQTDLATLVTTVVTTIWNVWLTLSTALLSLIMQLANNVLTWGIQIGFNFLNGIATYLSQIAGRVNSYLTQTLNYIISVGSRWVNTARQKANQLLNGVINFFRQLPGQAYSQLLAVLSHIVSAGAQWVSNARNKASEIVSGVVGILSGLPGRISSAISGVVSAITKPFQDAYNTLTGIVNNIKNKAAEVANIAIPAFGGDLPRGGDIVPDARGGDIIPENINENVEYDVNTDEKITVEGEVDVVLDLKNVPSHIDTNTLISMLQDKNVLRALVENKDFQSLDNMVKDRINYKYGRARGV